MGEDEGKERCGEVGVLVEDCQCTKGGSCHSERYLSLEQGIVGLYALDDCWRSWGWLILRDGGVRDQDQEDCTEGSNGEGGGEVERGVGERGEDEKIQRDERSVSSY